MSANEAAIEAEIQAKNLTAPRLNPSHIESQIVKESYHVFGGVMTVCCLTLKNGFMVIGDSAPASPANFDAALGKRIAREHARDKIWALEGYVLRSQLALTK